MEFAMISDVLADAVMAVDEYLGDPVFADVYEGELRDRILSVRHEMDRLRAELDALLPTRAEGAAS